MFKADSILSVQNQCCFLTMNWRDSYHSGIILTLPVRRYLVRKGRGVVEPTLPYDPENGRLYELQLLQAIRTIYER